MMLFTLLLVLAWERLFKLGEHWQLEHYLAYLFKRLPRANFAMSVLLMFFAITIVAGILQLTHYILFGIVTLVLWVLLGLLCIGAGIKRKYYREYLRAARRNEPLICEEYARKLSLIHGVPVVCTKEEQLRELQNALLWINYRYYLAPIFWMLVGGSYGPALLLGYAFLRAYQSWLAQHCSPFERTQSGVDALLHVLDWIPVRLAGGVYALLGHGERALPAWFSSLLDIHTPSYRVLTQLAQFSLAQDPHLDMVKTPIAAVHLARNVTMVILVAVALLTIYGAMI